MKDLLQIDGSILEGGGQLLRVAVALAAVTKKPIQVDKIRMKREKPGLRPQHISAIKSVGALVNAEMEGVEVGSQSIIFRPGELEAKDYRADVGTAGSTSLILQALMPALAFAPGAVHVTLTGGTNNPLAPSIEYMTHVIVPMLKKMGYSCQSELLRRGFYPAGGGEVRVVSRPVQSLRNLKLVTVEDVKSVGAFSYSCKLSQHITERMAKAASQILQSNDLPKPTVEIEALQAGDARCSFDPGCGLLITLEYSSGLIAGFDGLGERGKPAEKVAAEIAASAIKHVEQKAPIDPYLCDQLIIWVSLADGLSEIRTSKLTLHALTCMEIARQLLRVEFQVDGKLGEPATIRCKGISLVNAASAAMQDVI